MGGVVNLGISSRLFKYQFQSWEDELFLSNYIVMCVINQIKGMSFILKKEYVYNKNSCVPIFVKSDLTLL